MSARLPTMLRHLARARRGVVALEFAICASLTILVLIAVFEVGLMSWAKVAMQAGATAAARCSAIGNSACATVTTYTVSMVQNWLFAGAVAASDVTVQTGVTCNGATGKYTVITINSAGWGSLLPATLPTPLSKPSITATSCFVSGT